MWQLNKQLAFIAILGFSTTLLSQEKQETEKEKEVDPTEIAYAADFQTEEHFNVKDKEELAVLLRPQISIMATVMLTQLSADDGIQIDDDPTREIVCKLIKAASVTDLKIALMFNPNATSWVITLMKQKVYHAAFQDEILEGHELENLFQPRDASAFATVMLRQLADMETVDQEKVKLLVKHASVSDLYIALLLNPTGHQYVINAMREKVFTHMKDQNPELLSEQVAELTRSVLQHKQDYKKDYANFQEQVAAQIKGLNTLQAEALEKVKSDHREELAAARAELKETKQNLNDAKGDFRRRLKWLRFGVGHGVLGTMGAFAHEYFSIFRVSLLFGANLSVFSFMSLAALPVWFYLAIS